MSVVATEQLAKHYGRRVGVQELSLSVPEGSVFGFLGPNGSGKTTTIRVLMGFLKATGGTASVFGRDCWRESHRIKAEVGYLPGDLRLYPWLTCESALRIVELTRGRHLTAEGHELASKFGLDPDVRVRAMSRGMRQKLGLILALAHRPKLLILDEPTASLDPLMQETLYKHLRNLASNGHTIFFSSHTLKEVEDLCDRVAILREGRLVADETLEDLRARAKRMVTIRWQQGVKPGEINAPVFLEVRGRESREWEASLTGPVVDLVRWCAGQPIDDLSIGQPELASLFQQYYA